MVLLWIALGMGSSDETSEALLISPQRGPFQVTVTATGELQAQNSVKIYGPTGARQAQIFQIKIQRLIPEGTLVRQGDFVAELDRSELTSKMQEAQLNLEKAESQYTQTRLDTALTLSKERDNLINLHFASEESQLRMEQSKYEAPSVKRQAEIDYEKAERSYIQAQENYGKQVQQAVAKMRETSAELNRNRQKIQELTALTQGFTILAPENGMLVYRRDWRGQKLTTGGTVNAWDPVVATLPDLSVMESVTYVNEVDIQKVKEGQAVEIGLDAAPDKKLTGRVTQVANIGEQRPNSDAKVFEVSIVINEADSTLRPAMTTSNTIIVAEIPEALSIPLESLHTQDSLSFVYVNDGGYRQEVKLGLINENEATVEAGLSGSEQISLSIPPDGETWPLRCLGE